MLEEREGLAASLTDFTQAAWPQLERKQYLHNWHIDAIAEHLEAVSRRDIKRLIINVPFRTMKSTLVSVAWPAWVWANTPSHQFLCGSHAEKLATRDNLKMRRLVSSPWYRERWGNVFALTGDQNQKMRFENDQGGYRIGFGMTSGITGDGGDTVIIDDPHDRDSAQSEAERTTALETFDQSVITRLNDPDNSAIVVIMQRLHEEDLSGHLLKAGGWEHLMLPMEYEPKRKCVTGLGFKDPRTKADDLLWPERFPQHAVDALKKSLGTYGTSGQLQQSPAPPGGGLFKHEWWNPWTDAEATRLGCKPGLTPPLSYVLGVIDTAYTKQEENDPCAMVVLGIWKDARGQPQIMLCGAWEEWLEFNALVEKTAETCEEFSVDRLLIESKASGISVAQEINRRFSRSNWGVELIDPGKGDKLARAYAITSIFEGGQVWAPGFDDGTFRRWAEKVIDQMGKFPKDKHDDLTDAVVHGLKYLRDTGMLLRVDEHRRAEQEEATYQPPLQPLYPV